MRGRVALVASVLALTVLRPASATPTRAPVPGSPCTVFPADNVWNMDVSKLPIAKKNKVWRRSMHAGSTLLHPDFGPPAYGMPFDVVDGSHQTVHVDFNYADESDPGAHIRSDRTSRSKTAPIGTRGWSTRTLARSTSCTPSIGTAATPRRAAGRSSIWKALEGAIADDLRPAAWTSADAACLPIFPGLVRWDEVNAGAIHHAIRFTVDCTSQHYVWPARHQAGSNDGRCPPMGAPFRLKAGFDTSGYSADAKVIIDAMEHYGLIVADNGSDWYFQGEVNPHWTNDLMDELKSIPAGAFVAVNEAGCRVSPDSARFAYGPRCPAP